MSVLTGRPGPVTRVRAVRVDVEGPHRREEHLATEEPLEIRLAGQPFTVTMRTPGADVELALGLLHGEGVLRGPDDVLAARYCVDPSIGEEQRYNVVTVDLAPGVFVDWERHSRSGLTTSACGVCGTSSLDALHSRGLVPVAPGPVLDPTVLATLPDRLREAQRVFDRTGGLHAAGLFTPGGDSLVVREDVGRHNAVDKVVGWAFSQGRLPLSGLVLVVSGRTSYEIVQKAVSAGVAAVVGVSAPSSLAVATAREFGLTLVGFARGDRCTVYSGEDRLPPS
ncbi:MAG: formate dehydrogenase accessory sulfurtransferase FdhD [Motilibacteraceae bacterium]